ncbi:MAG: ABC transporter ATP-binding protein [Emergencia sp.]|nr:ABC transporter ATP-binding protein [Emergencia sp.]
MIFGRHINSYYFRYAPMLLLGTAALLLVDCLQLVIPNLYRQIINGMNRGFVVVDGESIPFDMDFLLDRICMPMTGIILAIVFGRFIWRIMFFGAATRVEAKIREDMFDNCRHLSCSYYQHNKVGNLMSLFTNDLDTVQECFGWGIMMFLDTLFLGVLAVAKMWNMNRTLTLLSLIPMAFLLAGATVVGRYMMIKWDIRQEAFSRLSDFSQESFSGIAVIKAFVKEAKELMAFRKLNIENEKANIDHTKASVLLRILVTMFVESVICIILGYGGYLVYRGVFDAGELVEFIGYFNAVVWPIMAVSELIDMTSRGKASLNRIGELLDARAEVKDRPDAQTLSDVKGEIRFEGLSFSYPQADREILSDITCTIKAGEQIGIVGKTGAGKTTLVDLLLRTYNAGDGMIFLDGRDINSLTVASVRDAFAYVPQDNFLFSDTIARNIAFGDDSALADKERIYTAAETADIASDIRGFSKGFETVLGERGVTVSGGQKQRISIARAFLRNAPVLILDDSVSAVDTKTEKTILQNLRTMRAGKTTLLIAHRISTIEQMDRILFLENGRLTAVGSHKELYESCSAYRTMVELQKLEEEGEKENA